MAFQIKPYLLNNRYTMDIDSNDIDFVVWDVSQDLADRNTTASSVVLIHKGTSAVQGPTIQGTNVIALMKMDQASSDPVRTATARVTCANGEQFDRSIDFNLEDH